MLPHTFLLQPGIWLGEGKVTFTASPDQLQFYTRWEISPPQAGIIALKQVVEMKEGDTIHNNYILSGLTENSFIIELTNDVLGTVIGKGIIDENKVAWEFRAQESFEGYEVYQLQTNGEYILHAEYASPEQYRTIIDAHLWPKIV
ncbi:MAG: hypothetical protein WC222_12070 [Parachlamydiales bacterium]|jgi:hypothetical protein